MYFYLHINLTYIYIFVMTLIRIYVSADPWITQRSHSVRSDPSDIERGDQRTAQSAAGHAPSSRCYRQTNALSRTRPHFAPLFWFFSHTDCAFSNEEVCGVFFARDLVVRRLQKSDP